MSLAVASYAAAYYPTTLAVGGRNVGNAAAGQLSTAEQAVVDQLQARDREVRQHEQAHLSAAGGLATSAASYTYQRGPDGVSYAVGGEVRIDVSPGRTPAETLRRAQTIQQAALAPANPSSQDRAVAAAAAQLALQARTELAREGPAASAGGNSDRREALGRTYGTTETQAPNIDTYA